MRIIAIGTFFSIYLLTFFGIGGYKYTTRSKDVVSMARDDLLPGTSDIQQKLNEISSETDSATTEINKEQPLKTMKVRRRSAVRPIGQMKSTVKLRIDTGIETKATIYSSGKPRFPNTETPLLEFDSEKFICNDNASARCIALSSTFGNSLQKEFHRVLMSESKVFKSGLSEHNTYNVDYDGATGKRYTREEIICELLGVSVQTLSVLDEPFASEGLEEPAAPLRGGQAYGTCAVVASAGAMLGSGLGPFIDSHDMVLRFNNAPTNNYTDDVGSKTTFRVLNSQVATKPEFNFFEDPIYDNISIIIWDPTKYTSTVEDWFQNPDFPLFDAFKKFLQLKPGADVHLLNPKVLWDLWTILQQTSEYRLRKNPPSSGFIGVWFALSRCERVRVFHFVPSARMTGRCHYYGEEVNRSCTIGSWHPLAQEKSLANQMRSNSDFQVFQRGFIEISTKVTCPE